MNRRSFFGLVAGLVADPERLLWEPGKKLISIPKPEGIPISNIAIWDAAYNRHMASLMLYQREYNRILSKQFVYRTVQSDFELALYPEARKIGDTLIIRQPARFRV